MFIQSFGQAVARYTCGEDDVKETDQKTLRLKRLVGLILFLGLFWAMRFGLAEFSDAAEGAVVKIAPDFLSVRLPKPAVFKAGDEIELTCSGGVIVFLIGKYTILEAAPTKPIIATPSQEGVRPVRPQPPK